VTSVAQPNWTGGHIDIEHRRAGADQLLGDRGAVDRVIDGAAHPRVLHRVLARASGGRPSDRNTSASSAPT